MAGHVETRILPAILCGGSGTRLWPLSRESMPRQFTPLVDPVSSTFQETARRVSDPAAFLPPVVVAAAESRFVVAEQLARAGVGADILLEPERRDTAAAVAVATLHASRLGPRTLVLAMAADHLSGDAADFAQAVARAAPAARDGRIVTLGVRPTHPSTAYGYVFPGAGLPSGVLEIERFVEKPDAAEAGRLIGKGALWNAGHFLFRADAMLAEFEVHAPEVLAAARAALDGAARDLDFVRLEPAAFSRAPRISLDYAVMERTRNAAVLPVDLAWSDIGTWDAVWEALPRDADGNALRGRVAAIGTRGSLVHGDSERLTAVVGLSDVVVVTTPDAVLVASKDQAGAVGDLVASLKAGGHPEAGEHLRIHRPWGWYQRVDLGPRFRVKRIMVVPGARLSLQRHHHRAEHWVVLQGTAEVTRDGEVVMVYENEAVQLPVGCVHRLANPGRIPLEIVEVQVGSYTGEDDIVRFQDDYDRPVEGA